MPDDVRRIEHLFAILGGKALIVPDMPHPVSYLNDAGEILLYMKQGLSADDRATLLAGTIFRHAAKRLDPVDLALLLRRALTGRAADRVAANATSTARWIPEEDR